MMTVQRKLRLRQKIQASRGRLMENCPFFGLLLMYLKFVAVPDMKKISTNGRCIYFSPQFIDKLYDYELDYILCHQIMHIVSGHIWRPFDREGADYHFACDIWTNLQLDAYGFNEEHYAHLGNMYRSIPGKNLRLTNMSEAEIFEQMFYSLYLFDDKTRNRYHPDDDFWWSHKEDSGQVGEIILDLDEEDVFLKEENGAGSGFDQEGKDGFGVGSGFHQKWQSRVVAMTKLMETIGKSAGGVPKFVKRMIDKMGKPTLDWKKILNIFMQEQICDYSFSPPDRRFSDTDFFLPDFNEKDFMSKDVLFMVDTSGSVEDEYLAEVYSEIKGAIEQFSGKLTGKLGFFDEMVTPPLPFENVDELMRIIPYGGGGTDFDVIFEYIRNNERDNLPAYVIIFTDGCADYPDESAAMGIPVLWIINNEEITPPWGKVIRLTSDSWE